MGNCMLAVCMKFQRMKVFHKCSFLQHKRNGKIFGFDDFEVS